MRDKANFFELSEAEQEQLQADGDVCIDNKGNIVTNGQTAFFFMADELVFIDI